MVPAEIQRTHERLKGIESANRRGFTMPQAGQASVTAGGSTVDRGYPAYLQRFTPEADTQFGLLRKADELGFQKPQLDAQTRQYLLEKMKDQDFLERERWVGQKFDLSSPERAAWFNAIMPSFTERRREYGEMKLAMQKQLLDLALYGPQSEADVDFLWALDTGKVDLEELRKPVWELRDANTARNTEAYAAGLFSPYKRVNPAKGKGQLDSERLGGLLGVDSRRDPNVGAGRQFFLPTQFTQQAGFDQGQTTGFNDLVN